MFTLMGFLAPYIPIQWFPHLQLLPIFIPYLIPLHVIGLLVIPFKNWQLKLAALMSLGLCVWIGLYEFRVKLYPNGTDESEFRVVTYNVRSFNYQPEEYIDTLSHLFRDVNPDLICFQEFNNTTDSENIEFLAVLSDKLQLPYRAFIKVAGSVGGAVLSKYPIIEYEKLYTSERGANIGMWAIIETPERRIGIYNVHLASYRLGSSYHRTRRKEKTNKYESLFKTIWKRASQVIPEQERMANIIYHHALQHQGNVIITGDLNSVPYTRIPTLFRKHFQDSFTISGSGYGMTYPLNDVFGMRIDYQFSSPTVEVLQHKVLKTRISDHYPVIVDYQFR